MSIVVKKFCFSLLSLFLIFAVVTCVGSPAGNNIRPRYLVRGDYHADPAAHVFNGILYVYPSHDRDSSARGNNGESYDMVDYHVFSLDDDVLNGNVTDHGVVLKLADIPWASVQLWDNDVAHKNGRYYMYFPAKDRDGLFRIGVAIADRPEGPFVPEAEPIRGSYSIDPCVFEDDGNYYMYFGGLWGGQLERHSDKIDRTEWPYKTTGEIISPRVVKLSDDMLQFAENPREVIILNKRGAPLTMSDSGRFFEASWMHKYNDTYYYSYSTGDTHNLCYATGDNPYGPFTYQGVILTEVSGWTTHHSIVEFNGKWYLFYHDSGLSGGISHLRSMKVTELTYLPDGTISRVIRK